MQSLLLVLCLLVCPYALSFSTATPPKLVVDHLVYVVSDLAKAMEEFEVQTGVRPVVGGKHTALGTHNAFVALGDGRYLELFAPDPQATVPVQTIIGVDGGRQPRLSTFCCNAGTVGIDKLVSRLGTLDDETTRSLFPSTVEQGSRRNEQDHAVISWRVAVDRHRSSWSELPMGGLLPFYIDWGEWFAVRPAATAPTGCTLQKLTAYHPQPVKLQDLYQLVGHGLEDLVVVKEGPEPKLVATLLTPKGTVELS